MDIISRKAAKAAGLKYYFTGEPCKRGHIDERFVSSFCCKTCAREKAAAEYRELDQGERQRLYLERREYLQQWKSENHEHVKELSAKHRAKYKAEKPDYFREFYAANKDRRKQESSAWYYANAEYAAKRQKAYEATRPIALRRALSRKKEANRRAIKKQVFVETVDARVVFERDNGICGICGGIVDVSSPWEVDHIVPVSRGGLHAYANVQLAHRSCNRKKWAKCAS